MKTIDEMKKEIERIEERKHELYQNRDKSLTTDDAREFKWYIENIDPLNEQKKQLERQIIRETNLNVKVGDGATLCLYTDREAYTIIKRTAKTITIQRDKAIRTDDNGMSDCQDYRYERDYDGIIRTARWSEVKGCFMYNGMRIATGRYEYYDYSF